MSEGANPRVLVAEDDRSVRESLIRALRLEGYDVTAVTDGEQALAAVDTEAPDLLVLDIMMPNVDGLTVCRRLRARQVTHADPHADRTARGVRSGRRARRRRRRLPRQAVRARRAVGAAARAAPPHQRLGRATTSRGRRSRARPARREPRSAASARSTSRRPSSTCSSCSWSTRASSSRARRSTSASGATTSRRARSSLDVYIGYLRAQDRGGGRAAARAHRARRRLPDPETMSLRWRIAAALGLVAALVCAFGAIAAYVSTSHRLENSVDESLLARRGRLSHIHGSPDGFGGGPHDRGVRRRRRAGVPAAGRLSVAVGVRGPRTSAQFVNVDGTRTSCIEGGPCSPSMPPIADRPARRRVASSDRRREREELPRSHRRPLRRRRVRDRAAASARSRRPVVAAGSVSGSSAPSVWRRRCSRVG